MNIDIDNLPISKAELARELGVSRTYVTLLTQGKRNPSKRIVDRLAQLQLTANLSVNTGTHEHLTFNQVLSISSNQIAASENHLWCLSPCNLTKGH